MKVTILIDDKKINQPDLVAEHGLSIHIEKNGRNILLDMGKSDLFMENASTLGISLEDVDVAVLSHGHYDHGGGLSAFFDKNKNAPLYLKKTAERKHFSKKSASDFKYVGLNKSFLENEPERIHFLSENTEINGLDIITNIKQKYPKPPGNKYLFEEINGEIINDDFNHELFLIVPELDGIHIFTGCCHNGLLNIVETAIDLYPEKKIKSIFGGFHMVIKSSDEEFALKEDLLNMGEKLMEYPIEKVYTCHCTGDKAYSLLKRIMGDKIDYCFTGTSIEL
ncbi:MBL fold metallo-hydrolase [Methanobacterium alcaliphilum]|uniref:MBL fold metallo-hydrolase n=1 Tax=Methanobacterium alcaliphilum TaxID=392018 RepID=UPI00200A152F|nr:MBL fold metallo-hydrolase [Methanobacterium alcaliphilum]MCK9150548.1 MBL fold metallo-hydrolase [Methanobacterium alcaliphilum]